MNNTLLVEEINRMYNDADISCLVENEEGASEGSTSLDVHYAPTILLHPRSQIARRLGNTLTYPDIPGHTRCHPVFPGHTRCHPDTPRHTRSHPVTPKPPALTKCPQEGQCDLPLRGGG